MTPPTNASKKPKRKRRKNTSQRDSDPLSLKELLKHTEENIIEGYKNKHYPLKPPQPFTTDRHAPDKLEHLEKS